MQFLWESFNIKTFPANTLVFLDGKFQPDLSVFDADILSIIKDKSGYTVEIIKQGKLPVHIISVGEIYEKLDLNIVSLVTCHLSLKMSCKKPAEFTLDVKNAGKGSNFHGSLLFKNDSDITINIFAGHSVENTGIFIKTKAVCGSKSETYMNASAMVWENCESDVSFSALCAPDIKKISFSPNQRIYKVPKSAEHSAAIWRGTEPVIEYLRESGLSKVEIDDILKEAFESDI